MARKRLPVVWLPAAANDLEAISRYIGRQSETYASRMIDRVMDAIEDLRLFPRMGPAVPDVVIEGIELRERLVHPYRVVYRIRDEPVVILAIVHGARLLGEALRGRRMQ